MRVGVDLGWERAAVESGVGIMKPTKQGKRTQLLVDTRTSSEEIKVFGMPKTRRNCNSE